MAAPEVDVGRYEIAEAFVMPAVIVVADEVIDLGFQVAGQILVLQQDAVLERLRAQRRSPDPLDAWALCHQGIYQLYRYSKVDNADARRLFRQAIEQDDQFAAAHTMLAYACFIAVFDALTDYRVDELTDSFEFAQKAVRLDDRDAMAHAILGRVVSIRHLHNEAIAECDKAIALNPSLAQAEFGGGLALVLAGHPSAAFANLTNAARLSPRDPKYYAVLLVHAWAELLERQFDSALEWARRAATQPNSGVWGNATLAIALAHLDRCEEARAALDALIEQKPDMYLGDSAV